MEKIQYYLSDLSALLDIGEIIDIYVHEENGSKILRITCKEKESGYKTVKSSKAPKKPTARTREPDFLHKAVDAGVSWLRKPMKRPDEW